MRPTVFAKTVFTKSPFANSLSQVNRSLLSIFCCFLIITALWLGVCLDNSSMALADRSPVRIAGVFDDAIAIQPNVMENLKNQVKDDFSEKTGSTMGHSNANPVKEKAKSSMGQPKRTFDNSAKQIESTGTAVDGRTEENVAKIQGKATDSGNGAENVIEDVMSNIRNTVN